MGSFMLFSLPGGDVMSGRRFPLGAPSSTRPWIERRRRPELPAPPTAWEDRARPYPPDGTVHDYSTAGECALVILTVHHGIVPVLGD
jgi:hypothetical protein